MGERSKGLDPEGSYEEEHELEVLRNVGGRYEEVVDWRYLEGVERGCFFLPANKKCGLGGRFTDGFGMNAGGYRSFAGIQ